MRLIKYNTKEGITWLVNEGRQRGKRVISSQKIISILDPISLGISSDAQLTMGWYASDKDKEFFSWFPLLFL